MDNTTLELLTRAEKLVRVWRPRLLGIGDGDFVDEAHAVIEAVTPDRGFEPLLTLLCIPDDGTGNEVAADVENALASRPDSVEPLLRILIAGDADGAERRDVVAAHRAFRALGAMELDALVPALLAVASGNGEMALREEGFNQLVKEGPNVVPALERLEADPQLGEAATRCLEKLEEYDFLPACCDPDASGTIGDLVYAYEDAETDDDAAYALEQLAELLEEHDWVVGAKALEPARAHVRRTVDAFLEASDEEEERSALDELAYFAAGCGDPGARLAREAIAEVPLTPGTQRLHDFAGTLVTAKHSSQPVAASIADAAARLSVAELQALTARPSFRRIRGVLLDVVNRPDFLEWERPEALPPLADDESHEGFIYLALCALCNDADDEFKAIAALALLGDREAVPLLRRLVDDPVGGEWVGRVIDWDRQIAAEAGVDLDTRARQEAGDGERPLAIDEMFEGVRGPAFADEAVEASEAVDEATEAAAPAVGSAEPAEEAAEPAEEPVEPVVGLGAEPALAPDEPMEPPGMASLDEALEEFVRRAESEPDADAATTAEREPGG